METHIHEKLPRVMSNAMWSLVAQNFGPSTACSFWLKNFLSQAIARYACHNFDGCPRPLLSPAQIPHNFRRFSLLVPATRADIAPDQ
jgi:hypothetical protein